MKTNHSFKLAALLLLFIFLGCQKENVLKLDTSTKEVIEEVNKNSNTPKFIQGDEIQDILGHLASKTNKTYSKISDLNGKINYNKAKILINHAMKVVNKGENTNYSFDLFLDDMPEYEFYSLIVSKTEDGVIEEPYVISYTMTKEDYNNYIEHELDFRYFRATQRFYTFDRFFADSAKGMTSRSGDCGSQTIGSGGTSGGGGGGSQTAPGETFTSNYSGTMLNSNFGLRQTSHLWVYEQIINTPLGSSTATTTTNSASVSATSTTSEGLYNYPPMTITLEDWASLTIYLDIPESGSSQARCSRVIRMLDGGFSVEFFDCPPSVQQKMGTTGKGSGTLSDCFVISGGVAINVTLLAVDINRKLGDIELSDDELALLTENKDNSALNIFKFLNTNDSPEAKMFAKLAIEKLAKDPDDELINFLFNLNLFQDTKINFNDLLDNFENIKGTHPNNETKKDWFSNYCAINLSHAMLKSGITINSKAVDKCYGCTDEEYKNKHAIRAQELADWLKKSNIDGVAKVKVLTGENFEEYVDGKKGIIFFKDYWQRDSDSGTNRTGDHIDLWNSNELVSSSWFGTWFRLAFPDLSESFGTSSLYNSKEVLFWEID